MGAIPAEKIFWVVRREMPRAVPWRVMFGTTSFSVVVTWVAVVPPGSGMGRETLTCSIFLGTYDTEGARRAGAPGGRSLEGEVRTDATDETTRSTTRKC